MKRVSKDILSSKIGLTSLNFIKDVYTHTRPANFTKNHSLF